MPYLNSDDRMPENDKVDALSDGAFRLYVSAMHYCAKKLTDGAIPETRLARLVPRHKPSQTAELLRGNLLHRGGEGCGTKTCIVGEPGEYVVHDYLEWNKSAQWWEAERARKAKNKADWAARNRTLKAVK